MLLSLCGQVRSGDAARHTRAGWNFSRGLLPRRQRRIGFPWPTLCATGLGIAARRPGREFHPHQEDAFRLALAGLP
jgi:hypothetical protein